MLQTKGMPKEALLNLIDSSVTGKTVYQEDIAALFQTYGDTYTYGYTDERKPGTLGWMKAQPQKELSNQAAPVEIPEGGMRYDTRRVTSTPTPQKRSTAGSTRSSVPSTSSSTFASAMTS